MVKSASVYIKNVFIEQPDDSWRYADLCFNTKDKYLYCLKTKPGSYQIDTISTKSLSQSGDVIVQPSFPKLFLDIS